MIIDGKFSDIDKSLIKYLQAILLDLEADAVTLEIAYIGIEDNLAKVAADRRFKDKGFIILTRSTNKGATELQYQKLENGEEVYINTARRVYEAKQQWDLDLALVVGATDVDTENGTAIVAMNKLSEVFEESGPKLPFLIPGYGAQNGSVETIKQAQRCNIHTYVNNSTNLTFAHQVGLSEQALPEKLKNCNY